MTANTYQIGPHIFAAPPLDPALYLVSTPIGHLRDITLRALETLAGADRIACEDTRTSRTLLARYGITRPLMACHDHNEAQAADTIVAALGNGEAVAFVSDAGTPLVSDPGYRLASAVARAGFRVIPIPGASSVLAALAASGLPSDTFTFYGFLPTKEKALREAFGSLVGSKSTVIFFESPKRIAKALAVARELLGPDRPATVARELTKMHEEVLRGTMAEIAEQLTPDKQRGEFVLIIGPDETTAADDWTDAGVDALLVDLARTLPASKAASEASRMTGRAKGDLYKRLLALKP